MSTQYKPFQYEKENPPKLSQIFSIEIFFQRTQERILNIRFRRAKCVCATEGLLYAVTVFTERTVRQAIRKINMVIVASFFHSNTVNEDIISIKR